MGASVGVTAQDQRVRERATEFWGGEWHVPTAEGPPPSAVVTAPTDVIPHWQWWAAGKMGDAPSYDAACKEAVDYIRTLHASEVYRVVREVISDIELYQSDVRAYEAARQAASREFSEQVAACMGPDGPRNGCEARGAGAPVAYCHRHRTGAKPVPPPPGPPQLLSIAARLRSALLPDHVGAHAATPDVDHAADSWPARVRSVLVETTEGYRLLDAIRGCSIEMRDGHAHELNIDEYQFTNAEVDKLMVAALSFWQALRKREGAR